MGEKEGNEGMESGGAQANCPENFVGERGTAALQNLAGFRMSVRSPSLFGLRVHLTSIKQITRKR